MKEKNKQYTSINKITKKGSWIKILLSCIFVVLLFIGFNKYYDMKYSGDNGKYSYKINNTKITTNCFNYFLKQKDNDETNTLLYITDLLIYNDIAKEYNITVSKEEISSIDSKYMKEEIALSNKIKELSKSKIDNIEEKDLKQFYEEEKYLFIKNGSINFIALTSDKDLSNETIDTSKYTINKMSIEELLSSGFPPTDLMNNNLVLISNENNQYKYFYITKVSPSEYYSYKEVKNKVLEDYKDKYGTNGLLKYISKKEDIAIIEKYN